MRYIYLGICLLIQTEIFAQLENPYNQQNEKGEKHGYWKVYVDVFWNKVSDTNLAKYYYYTYYHHAKQIIGLHEKFTNTEEKTKPLKLQGKNNNSPWVIPLDGKYKVIINEDKGRYKELVFEDGFLKSFYHHYDNTGIKWEKYDYSKKHQNIEASYYYEGQFNTRKIAKGFIYYPPNSIKAKDLVEKIKLE